MREQTYVPIYELTRGDIVESVHFGAIAIVDARGKLVASHGDPWGLTFLRSSAKPLQLLAFIEQGGQAYYNLSSQEVAIMCASHSGTDDQVNVIKRIQQKAAISESDLRCGVHPPVHRPTYEALRKRGDTPTQNHHNCSGKHTGMLAFASMLGEPTQDYLDTQHPVQKVILQTFSDMCGAPADKIVVGTDGCSAPNFAVPLYNAAYAIARLCDPQNSIPALSKNRAAACHTITEAMVKNPDMVGGPNSFDTHLMSATAGSLLSKGGAEGYQIVGVFPGVFTTDSPGLGIAIKISDGDLKSHTRPVGDQRGQVRPAVVLEILRQLGLLTPEIQEKLADYGPTFSLFNWRRLLVGSARPNFQLLMESLVAGPNAVPGKP